MLYDRTIKEILEKKKRKEEGKFNGVPFCFDRYSEYFDSLDKGMYLGILGGTGVGKSSLKHHMIYSIMDFSTKNDYPVMILDFSLEDPETEVCKKRMIHYLWKRHKVDLNLKYLNSRDRPLDDKYTDLIQKDELFWRKFESSVAVINNCTTPNEIHTMCEKAYEKYGDSRHYFVFVDNYANICKDEHDLTEWAATRRWSRNIARLRLCKTLNMTVIGILQQNLETEQNAMRNAGKGSLLSIEPNMSSIGDNRVIARDLYCLLALWSPWRYEIEQYPYSGAYNVKVLRDRFRSLLMLKNNHGPIAPRLGLLFDGKHEIFEEMPPVEDKEALDKLYTKILNEEKQKKMKNPTFWES